MIRVALIGRSSLLEVRGGDTIQILKTKDALKKLGVFADVRLANESIDYKQYDLLHFFNLIRPADFLNHAHKSGLPYVLSPIYVDYSTFDQQDRGFILRNISRILGKHHSEYLKTLIRWGFGQDSLVSWTYLFGHKRAMTKLVKGSKMLLPNSENEARRIHEDLEMKFNFNVIPNAIDPSLFYPSSKPVERRKRVICVAQIEGRKNQLRVINATKDLDVDLLIVGKPSPNNIAYYERCKKEALEHVKFIEFLPQEKLQELYSSSDVHVLASWFETTGLSSLEAGACGCNLVISNQGDAIEYFNGYAEVCEPDSVSSIRRAIVTALKKPRSTDLQELIRTNYQWERTASLTSDCYKEVLA